MTGGACRPKTKGRTDKKINLAESCRFGKALGISAPGAMKRPLSNKERQKAFPPENMLQQVTEAMATNDRESLGTALLLAKQHTRHGAWANLCGYLGIPTRTASHYMNLKSASKSASPVNGVPVPLRSNIVFKNYNRRVRSLFEKKTRRIQSLQTQLTEAIAERDTARWENDDLEERIAIMADGDSDKEMLARKVQHVNARNRQLETSCNDAYRERDRLKRKLGRAKSALVRGDAHKDILKKVFGIAAAPQPEKRNGEIRIP